MFSWLVFSRCLFVGIVRRYPSYFKNITGSNDYDNFMRTNAPAAWGPYGDYLNTPAVRASLHVGAVPYVHWTNPLVFAFQL